MAARVLTGKRKCPALLQEGLGGFNASIADIIRQSLYNLKRERSNETIPKLSRNIPQGQYPPQPERLRDLSQGYCRDRGEAFLEKKTVFIVEDNPTISEILTDKIRKMGYSVCDPVRTGEEAIEVCKKIRPDLVVMDITLEGDMDGIEAGMQIKKRFNIPFVFLTAYEGSELPDRMREAEPDGYIVKPFSDKDIRAMLHSLL
ncbi:MAG TPA: response regulator [Methanoregulaceae archaeon]|nr:response regulator [Methanoregulaceae archaeon]HPD76067.1 response regulator [Methanoregulaceae archaeon]